MAKKKQEVLVKVPCILDDADVMETHAEDTVTLDVADWTAWDFRMIPETSPHDLWNYIERDAVGWEVTGTNGEAVPFPGRGADEEEWQAAYKNIPYAVSRWLALSPYWALGRATEPDKKRTGGRTASST
jgi:hypothetical protein